MVRVGNEQAKRQRRHLSSTRIVWAPRQKYERFKCFEELTSAELPMVLTVRVDKRISGDRITLHRPKRRFQRVGAQVSLVAYGCVSPSALLSPRSVTYLRSTILGTYGFHISRYQ